MEKFQCRNNIRVVLAKKELSNRWLAQKMGVTDMTVSRWCTNKIQPSMAQFLCMSKLLNVELKDLVETE